MQATAKSKQLERESDREGQATTNRKRPRRASNQKEQATTKNKRQGSASDREEQASRKSKRPRRTSDRKEQQPSFSSAQEKDYSARRQKILRLFGYVSTPLRCSVLLARSRAPHSQDNVARLTYS